MALLGQGDHARIIQLTDRCVPSSTRTCFYGASNATTPVASYRYFEGHDFTAIFFHLDIYAQ